jgi:hypothetical protein
MINTNNVIEICSGCAARLELGEPTASHYGTCEHCEAWGVIYYIPQEVEHMPNRWYEDCPNCNSPVICEIPEDIKLNLPDKITISIQFFNTRNGERDFHILEEEFDTGRVYYPDMRYTHPDSNREFDLELKRVTISRDTGKIEFIYDGSPPETVLHTFN